MMVLIYKCFIDDQTFICSTTKNLSESTKSLKNHMISSNKNISQKINLERINIDDVSIEKIETISLDTYNQINERIKHWANQERKIKKSNVIPEYIKKMDLKNEVIRLDFS